MAIPQILIYMFLNLFPLCYQMLTTDRNAFLICTILFTASIIPFGAIEMIEIYNYKETKYTDDKWNKVDLLNVLIVLAYSAMSFVYMEEIT